MKDYKALLHKTFVEYENKKISIVHKELPDGGTKPVIKYGSKGFLSPSRMLKYKSKQIYEDSVGS